MALLSLYKLTEGVCGGSKNNKGLYPRFFVTVVSRAVKAGLYTNDSISESSDT
jgi:hypothetical protein